MVGWQKRVLVTFCVNTFGEDLKAVRSKYEAGMEYTARERTQTVSSPSFYSLTDDVWAFSLPLFNY
jgi:hypothetical protein